MKVSEIMSNDAMTIAPNATLQEACQLMRDEDVGFLPVCDGEEIKGALTDRDIITRGIASGVDPMKTSVQEVMSRDIAYIFEDQELSDAAQLMESRQIRRLVVVDREKKLVGIITLGDLSTQGDDDGLAVEVLERVSEPWKSYVNI